MNPPIWFQIPLDHHLPNINKLKALGLEILDVKGGAARVQFGMTVSSSTNHDDELDACNRTSSQMLQIPHFFPKLCTNVNRSWENASFFLFLQRLYLPGANSSMHMIHSYPQEYIGCALRLQIQTKRAVALGFNEKSAALC